MPLFICSKCGVIENTALCGYWWKDKKNPLCSECDPDLKKWHNKFPKKKWDGKLEVLNPPTKKGEK